MFAFLNENGFPFLHGFREMRLAWIKGTLIVANVFQLSFNLKIDPTSRSDFFKNLPILGKLKHFGSSFVTFY